MIRGEEEHHLARTRTHTFFYENSIRNVFPPVNFSGARRVRTLAFNFPSTFDLAH